MIAALIPLKDPEKSKQRLSDLLVAEERYELALAMLKDVVAAVVEASRIQRTIILGGGEAAARVARLSGCEFIPDWDNRGETEAVALGPQALQGSVDGLLVLPADVPLVRPEDVDALVSKSDEGARVVLCPARDGCGTNGALRCPGEIMPLTFGNNSFHPHYNLALQLGIPLAVVELPRLGLDLDRPEDVATYIRESHSGETHRYLTSIRVDKRLSRWNSQVRSFSNQRNYDGVIST